MIASKDHFLNQSFLTGFSCGICLTAALLFIRRLGSKDKGSGQTDDDEHPYAEDGDDDIKLILVVRTDLKMTKGKAAAQCAHAAVEAYRKASISKAVTLQRWKEMGQPKIVVKCDSQEELLQLASVAREKKLLTSLIADAGRTQIAPGSRTVLGIGPGPVDAINKVTGHLKLY